MKGNCNPEGKTITVTWRRSANGRPKNQKKVIQGLGFKRLHQTLTLPNRPEIRGMIQHVIHLLEVTDGSERKKG